MADWKKVIVSGSTAELAGLTLSGDLTVAGGDITLGSTSIFSGGDTTSLNNIDAIDATTEATIEAAIDTLSNLTAASSLVTVGTLNSGAISSGFGNIDNGTSTLNTGNATVDTLTNDSAVADSHITGSFTGSFVGDGSGLTGLTSANDATITLSPGAGIGAIGDFTTNQSGNETLTIGVDGVLEDLDTLGAAASDGQFIVATGAGAFAYESGATALTSLGATATGQAVLTGSNAAAIRTTLGLTIGTDVQAYDAGLAYLDGLNFTDEGTFKAGVNLEIGTDVQAYDAQLADIAGLATTDGGIIVGDGANFVLESGATARTSLGVGTGDSPEFTNLTLSGDLTVNGTTTTVATTNLLVEDRFILMNSGSATGDGGIIVQTESTASGSAFAWDDSEARWGFQIGTKLGQNATVVAPDAYVASVVTSDDATYQKNGNIRVQGGEIYIYVE